MSRFEIGLEPVENDPPASRGATTANLHALNEPVVNEVALSTTDNRQAVLGQGGKLGAPQAVAELARLIGDPGHHPEDCSDGAGRDPRLWG